MLFQGNLLDGLPNWLDRLFEGTTHRYCINYWPDFTCKWRNSGKWRWLRPVVDARIIALFILPYVSWRRCLDNSVSSSEGQAAWNVCLISIRTGKQFALSCHFWGTSNHLFRRMLFCRGKDVRISSVVVSWFFSWFSSVTDFSAAFSFYSDLIFLAKLLANSGFINFCCLFSSHLFSFFFCYLEVFDAVRNIDRHFSPYSILVSVRIKISQHGFR